MRSSLSHRSSKPSQKARQATAGDFGWIQVHSSLITKLVSAFHQTKPRVGLNLRIPSTPPLCLFLFRVDWSESRKVRATTTTAAHGEHWTEEACRRGRAIPVRRGICHVSSTVGLPQDVWSVSCLITVRIATPQACRTGKARHRRGFRCSDTYYLLGSDALAKNPAWMNRAGR